MHFDCTSRFLLYMHQWVSTQQLHVPGWSSFYELEVQRGVTQAGDQKYSRLKCLLFQRFGDSSLFGSSSSDYYLKKSHLVVFCIYQTAIGCQDFLQILVCYSFACDASQTACQLHSLIGPCISPIVILASILRFTANCQKPVRLVIFFSKLRWF